MSAIQDMIDSVLTSLDPVLYEGDCGIETVELQKLLNHRGADLVIDGFFGPVTKAAVLQFQQQRGLNLDGIADSSTWAALRQDEPLLRLADICLNYDPINYPNQIKALEWLQNQISPTTLREFVKRWYTQ